MSDSEKDEERVTAKTYGALDVMNVTDECWVLRVPQKLWDVWDSLPEGTDLGELVFTKGGPRDGQTTKPSLDVHVNEASLPQNESAAVVPRSYSLQAMTKKIPTMHPIVRNSKNGTVKLLGTVTRTANMTPKIEDSNYKAMVKDRLVTSNITGNRFVKPVDATDSIMTKQTQSTSTLGQGSRQKGFGNAVLQFGQRLIEAQEAQAARLKEGGPAQKRSRQFSPDQPLKSVIFELFQNQMYWSVKDLKNAAVAGGCSSAADKKAEGEMRDILREIGDYHRSGEHKNEWSLKAEFQQQS